MLGSLLFSMRQYLLLLGLGLGLFSVGCKAQEPQQIVHVLTRSPLEQEVDKLSVFAVIQDEGLAVFGNKQEAMEYLVREDGTYTGTLAHFNNRDEILEYARQRRDGNRPKIDDGHRYIEGCKPKDIAYFMKKWEERDNKIKEWKKAGVWNFPYFITFEGQESPLK